MSHTSYLVKITVSFDAMYFFYVMYNYQANKQLYLNAKNF